MKENPVDMREVLSKALFPEEKAVENNEQKEEIKQEIKEEIPNPMLEEFEEEESSKEIKELDKEEDQEIKRKLSGYPKEFRELVESVKDEEIKTKILNAGKISRAREDRLSLELGNLKKEYNNAKGLLELIDKDPVNALKHIAKVTKVNLNNIIEKPVQEEEVYDYRSPEEIALEKINKKFEDIERKIYLKEQEEISRQNAETSKIIEDFRNSVDENGDLKYPYFDRVSKNMAPFFDERSPLFDPNITMEKAYKKAILLDDDLISERDAEILKQKEKVKQEEIEKAKKLKKFTSKSVTSTTPVTPKDRLSEIIDNYLLNKK